MDIVDITLIMTKTRTSSKTYTDDGSSDKITDPTNYKLIWNIFLNPQLHFPYDREYYSLDLPQRSHENWRSKIYCIVSSGKTNCFSGHNYMWYQSIWNNIKLLKSQKTVTKQNWNIKSKLSRYKDKLNNLNKQVHKWLTNQFFEASASFEKIYFLNKAYI